MTMGERVAVAMAVESDSSKKRRRQNRRLKQSSLDNGAVANASLEVFGGETSKSCTLLLPSSSPPERSAGASGKIPGRRYFSPYLSEQAVKEAVEKGNAFKATFHVNAYNCLEAYCTIKDVPIDVLIYGAEAQNRAIEGDVVAVTLDPVAHWAKLKGTNVLHSSTAANDSCSPDDSREMIGCSSSCDDRSDGINGALQENLNESPLSEQGEAARALERICAMIRSYPLKRPTGRVLAIVKSSPRRVAVIGFLAVKQSAMDDESFGKQFNGQFSKKNKNGRAANEKKWIHLIPTDPKFPKMVVDVSTLPECIIDRVKAGDVTVERELVAAEIDEWSEEALSPQAQIIHVFGRGGQIEPQIAAILFENAICAAKFSPESLACLPNKPWKIPEDEFRSRKDLRNICLFTIDPSSAIDLDDALSVEIVSDEIIRVGVHIADVSYFVLPDTALDTEAQVRSTSVYILQHKLPMLPPELSEELCSLLPGEDRLAISVFWDIYQFGIVTNRRIVRSIINSCCKLSYDFVQDVIDKSFDVDEVSVSTSRCTQLYGDFSLKDVIRSLRTLYEISTRLRETRFDDGALLLETSKLGFLFDEHGTPYDSFINERKESCCLVEEFMLLANRSVAEVISQAFPDCALLRRHPEPNLRKLKAFETFCSKHGFELDTSSSGQLHLSLSKIREEIKNDPVLFDIFMLYASRPMQSAVYFCTGELKGRQNEWAHYALSIPLYTHFTSPIRRYPDIIVHRTLCSVLHAEQMYVKESLNNQEAHENERKCFTGLYFNKHAAESTFGREALSASALKFKVPGSDALGEVAAHCNDRKLASRHAEEAGEKLYLWALLKKKGTLVTEARVLALGPRFVSVYIQSLSIERRIYYDEVDFLTVEWLEMTGALVLDLIRGNISRRRGSPGKFCPLEDVVLLTEPSGSYLDEEGSQIASFGSSFANFTPSGLPENCNLEAAVFPLVLQNLSFVPVALHAIGGDDGPLEIGVKFYMSSYFR